MNFKIYLHPGPYVTNKNYGNTQKAVVGEGSCSNPETRFTYSTILVDMNGHGEELGELLTIGMPFRATIFDLDGTLLDTLDDIANAANRVLAARGFPTHPNPHYRTLIGDGVVKLMSRALPEAHQDEAAVQACVAAYVREYERTWKTQTKPYAGVPEMLDALVARGLKLAVLSNKPDHFTQRCVDELLAEWAFDVVLGASDMFPRKPNPASALETAKRLGVPPAECLYVGDSGVDMQTARAARMCSVGALWGFRGKEELLKDGAQHLINKPSKVLDLLDRESHGR